MQTFPGQPVVFLMYHELELSGRSPCQSEPGYMRYVLRAPDFEDQMRFLKNAGWHGTSIGAALAAPQPRVGITFDDGCETDLLYAAPLLLELGFGATFYITFGFLGRRGYLSASQVRELGDLGFEIGCHSMTHAYLTDLDEAGLNCEMADPKIRLEQLLGRPVHHFSCPGGRFSQRVVEAARRAGYRSLANSRAHANSAFTDPFFLGRVAMMRTTRLDSFEAICRGRGLWRMSLRDGLRRGARCVIGNSFYDGIRTAMLGHGVPPSS